MIGVSFGCCQGWYLPAPSRRAVLICQPHGFEDLCARRSLRLLSEQLAEAGLPVLRFDYPGVANSLGGDEDEGLVARWRASIAEAVAWLETRTGAEEIVVIGLRLGALLAALEAPSLPRLAGIALLAPVTSGRQYVREMRVLAKIMRPPNSDAVAIGAERNPDAIDVCGFCISRETEADLRHLNLMAPALPPGTSVLLMPQKGVNASALAKAYESGGSDVTVYEFIGYEEMICDPTASKVPHAALGAIVAWAARGAPAAAAEPMHDVQSSLAGGLWSETGVTFGEGLRLAGILCRPTVTSSGATPVIFTNAGMSYHIGWARMTVRMARALAEKGIPSLRFDAAGIGDSAVSSQSSELPLYNKVAERSLTEAVDWMDLNGLGQPLLVGACSGAYTAFHVTRTDPRIKAAVIVNLQCFEWTPAIGLEVEKWRVIRRSQLAMERKAHGASNVLVAGLVSKGLKLVRSLGRLVKRALRSRAGGDGASVALWFGQLAARRTQVALVYSDGDAGLTALAAEAGPNGERIASLPGIGVHVIKNADHNLTPRNAQDDLLDIILERAAGKTSIGISAAASRRTRGT